MRVQRALIEQAGLRDDVEIRIENSTLVVSAARHLRPDADALASAEWDPTKWQW